MSSTEGIQEAAILGGQLRAARESIGLSVAEAAEAVGASPDELVAWESDKAQPPVEGLWELAELYFRSVDYFLRPTPPPPANVSFRVTRAKALRDLSLDARQVLARFEELCRAQTDLERLLGEPAPSPLPSVDGAVDPEALAESERGRLGLADRPISDLRGVLEGDGVRVFERQVPGDEVAGLSWRHAAYGPCILVNAGDRLERRRWTVAHEYFHVVTSESAHICDLESVGSSEERLAQGFAANFLMPPEAFLSDWEKRGAPGEGLTW
ncbi:MAG: ImmA/IrrE family metallo-endopeptidase, partial [Armatimonadota bacterium]